MKKLMVILDNGHGEETPGKRSPDGRLREYKWCREMVEKIINRMEDYNIGFHILVPENNDISLKERVKRVNDLIIKYEVKGYDTILVSVHNNAGGNGKEWNECTGTVTYVYRDCDEKSKVLGKIYGETNHLLSLEGDRYIPSEKYFTSGFYILKYSKCPSILVEHGFMDSKKDIEFLLSEDGIEQLLDMHEIALTTYAKEYGYEV